MFSIHRTNLDSGPRQLSHGRTPSRISAAMIVASRLIDDRPDVTSAAFLLMKVFEGVGVPASPRSRSD
jgi:hypothetical protein